MTQFKLTPTTEPQIISNGIPSALHLSVASFDNADNIKFDPSVNDREIRVQTPGNRRISARVPYEYAPNGFVQLNATVNGQPAGVLNIVRSGQFVAGEIVLGLAAGDVIGLEILQAQEPEGDLTIISDPVLNGIDVHSV